MGISPRQIVLVDELGDAERQTIYAWLREHNLAANAEFMTARERPEHAAWPLYAVAIDAASGRVIGGLVAETQFAWLKIAIMTIDPSFRRQGVGQALLDAAEREAVMRDCRYAYVDTMDYQAPAFYERAGYGMAGRLEDWDSHGHAKLFMTKRLGGATGG